jgi:hypothetical protein
VCDADCASSKCLSGPRARRRSRFPEKLRRPWPSMVVWCGNHSNDGPCFVSICRAFFGSPLSSGLRQLVPVDETRSRQMVAAVIPHTLHSSSAGSFSPFLRGSPSLLSLLTHTLPALRIPRTNVHRALIEPLRSAPLASTHALFYCPPLLSYHLRPQSRASPSPSYSVVAYILLP